MRKGRAKGNLKLNGVRVAILPNSALRLMRKWKKLHHFIIVSPPLSFILAALVSTIQNMTIVLLTQKILRISFCQIRKKC